jgi:hypothetical protein
MVDTTLELNGRHASLTVVPYKADLLIRHRDQQERKHESHWIGGSRWWIDYKLSKKQRRYPERRPKIEEERGKDGEQADLLGMMPAVMQTDGVVWVLRTRVGKRGRGPVGEADSGIRSVCDAKGGGHKASGAYSRAQTRAGKGRRTHRSRAPVVRLLNFCHDLATLGSLLLDLRIVVPDNDKAVEVVLCDVAGDVLAGEDGAVERLDRRVELLA